MTSERAGGNRLDIQPCAFLRLRFSARRIGGYSGVIFLGHALAKKSDIQTYAFLPIGWFGWVFWVEALSPEI
jgi:hypothetical protein